jgi:hypothetical protein
VTGLALSLAVVAAACLPAPRPPKSIGLPTARRTVSSTIVTTTTSTTTSTTTTTVPSTTVPSTTVPPTTAPPVEVPVDTRPVDPAPSSAIDVCGQLRQAPAGSTVVVPTGTWSIGNCVIDGALRSDVTVRSERAAAPTVGVAATSTLVGSLRCSDCDGWTFDGLAVRGDGSLVDPSHVVSMARGRGWTWVRCDLSNGVDDRGVTHGVRGVLSTWQEARDWQVTECRIHDNGNSRPGVEDNNHDHLIYVNGFASTTSVNGRVGPGNVFEGNRHGAPVKVGYGVDSSNFPVGVRGVRVERNVIRDNTSPDGNCGVLVAGDSPWTVVSDNTIDCTLTPTEATTSAISLRHWPSGSQVRIERNAVVGAKNAGLASACGSFVTSGGYDHTVTVRQWLTGWWFTVAADSCSWNGLTLAGNTSAAG